MPSQINGKTFSSVFFGSTPIAEAYRGPTLVWQNVPKVTIIPGTSAQGQLRAALADRGLTYSTVTEIPFALDTSNVTDMSSMFAGCSSLTSVPQMDTSKVTNMYNMFYNCSALRSVPDMDTSNVMDMSYMFQNCSSLTDGNVRCIGRKNGVNTKLMIRGSGLTRLPIYDANGNYWS